MYKRYSPPKNLNNNMQQNPNNSHLNYSQRHINYMNQIVSDGNGKIISNSATQNHNRGNTNYMNRPLNQQSQQNMRTNNVGFEKPETKKNESTLKNEIQNECDNRKDVNTNKIDNISRCDKVNSYDDKTENNLRDIINSVLRILPKSIYDSKSKKFFGIIGSEDLLLIMLIFLLTENDEGENYIIYALLYLLVSDYIDIPLL